MKALCTCAKVSIHRKAHIAYLVSTISFTIFKLAWQAAAAARAAIFLRLSSLQSLLHWCLGRKEQDYGQVVWRFPYFWLASGSNCPAAALLRQPGFLRLMILESVSAINFLRAVEMFTILARLQLELPFGCIVHQGKILRRRVLPHMEIQICHQLTPGQRGQRKHDSLLFILPPHCLSRREATRIRQSFPPISLQGTQHAYLQTYTHPRQQSLSSTICTDSTQVSRTCIWTRLFL